MTVATQLLLDHLAFHTAIDFKTKSSHLSLTPLYPVFLCINPVSPRLFIPLLFVFLFHSYIFSFCPSSFSLPHSHLSHLQWKHPNLQMLSINHLHSNYNPINLCFHAPCCRTASTLPPQSLRSERARDGATEGWG